MLRLFGLMILAMGQPSQGQTLSAEALYHRCHAHFTGQQPLPTDPRLIATKAAGTLSAAVTQCMALIDAARLDTDGTIVTKADSPSGPTDVDPTARRVLQTFNDFHNGWFERWDFYADDLCDTHEIYDIGEAGLHLTNSLLNFDPSSSNSPNAPYSTVITGSSTFETIRISEAGVTQRYFINCPPWMDPTDSYTFKYGSSQTTWTPKRTAIGRLVGIQPFDTASDSTVPEISLQFNSTFVSNTRKDHEPHGAGVIGTVPYILLNAGRGISSGPYNGGVTLPRRWSAQVVKEMLCRDLPVLRSEDVTDHVQDSGSTSIAFRTGQSCMTCHLTMDRMAGAIRHLQVGVSSLTFMPGQGSTIHIHEHSNSVGTEETHPVEDDNQFHLRPRKGTFNFRTYEGQLLQTSFNNLSELGDAIAATDDYYLCAAKKYYHFLTGVDVPIRDFTDPTAPTASTVELNHRQTLINLGKSLRSHQSLRTLVQEIISLPIYQDRTYGGP